MALEGPISKTEAEKFEAIFLCRGKSEKMRLFSALTEAEKLKFAPWCEAKIEMLEQTLAQTTHRFEQYKDTLQAGGERSLLERFDSVGTVLTLASMVTDAASSRNTGDLQRHLSAADAALSEELQRKGLRM